MLFVPVTLTLMYELDLDIPKMYMHIRRSMLSKVKALQTRKETDATTFAGRNERQTIQFTCKVPQQWLHELKNQLLWCSLFSVLSFKLSQTQPRFDGLDVVSQEPGGVAETQLASVVCCAVPPLTQPSYTSAPRCNTRDIKAGVQFITWRHTSATLSPSCDHLSEWPHHRVTRARSTETLTPDRRLPTHLIFQSNVSRCKIQILNCPVMYQRAIGPKLLPP